jgi:serine/threonine protein kinase
MDLLAFSAIKSANILFNDQAEIKLADFGIAQQLSEELLSFKGTAGYIHYHPLYFLQELNSFSKAMT